MSQSAGGPFRYALCQTADQTIFNKAAWVSSYTVQNKTAAAVDISFYDDAVGGSSNPAELFTIGANQSQAIYPNFQTLNGLGIKASLWTNLTVSVKWTPR